MADETIPVQPCEKNWRSELEKSRESAARLLGKLARTIRASGGPVRNTASGFERAAHYVQAHSVDEMAAGINRAVRKRPAVSIGVAVLAGFVIGRALRSR